MLKRSLFIASLLHEVRVKIKRCKIYFGVKLTPTYTHGVTLKTFVLHQKLHNLKKDFITYVEGLSFLKFHLYNF